MATLEVHSLSQKQTLSSPSIFQTVSEEVLSHIVEEVLKTEDPQKFVSETLKQAKRYKETGLLSVTRDLVIRYDVEGAIQKPLISDGFKINSIERVLVYISILTALAALLSKSPEISVEYNQTLIESCEQCYIELKKEE